MKKALVVLVAVMLVFSFAACKKKEQAPVAGQGELPAGHPQPGAPGVVMPPQQTQIVVPDNVKGKWSSVKIGLEDKVAKSMKDVTVKLGGEYKVPNSNLVIKVEEFLPDFKMEGAIITSASDQPVNPAVKIHVAEGGKEVFKGWLYAKFPAIHPFQHEKYGITLREGQK